MKMKAYLVIYLENWYEKTLSYEIIEHKSRKQAIDVFKKFSPSKKIVAVRLYNNDLYL